MSIRYKREGGREGRTEGVHRKGGRGRGERMCGEVIT
jgi:hypothetical protein